MKRDPCFSSILLMVHESISSRMCYQPNGDGNWIQKWRNSNTFEKIRRRRLCLPQTETNRKSSYNLKPLKHPTSKSHLGEIILSRWRRRTHQLHRQKENQTRLISSDVALAWNSRRCRGTVSRLWAEIRDTFSEIFIYVFFFFSFFFFWGDTVFFFYIAVF